MMAADVGGLNVPYAVLEGLVAVGATIGNGLVIVAFHRERRLRRRTNYYIVSLAVADLLVGLVGIPCAVLSSVGLPRHLHLCMFSVSLIIVLCTVSILSLVAVSADRYWAILYPMAYSTNSNTKIAISKYLYTCTRVYVRSSTRVPLLLLSTTFVESSKYNYKIHSNCMYVNYLTI